VARFDGGYVTSDGGALLLREVERQTSILHRLAACFTDQRAPAHIEHTAEDLIKQRVYAIALGYEDLNDHDRLRHDPLLAVLVGKPDPTGQARRRARDRGKALAGKSTLNRLELRPPQATPKETRYKKILSDPAAVDRVLVELFLEAHATPPPEIILDLDATDDPVHGHQEARFFHGYYGHYCYLPLYIFAGEFLLCARLRSANRDASAGALEEIERIVDTIRTRWATVRVTLRADAGFCREPLMAWCEAHEIDYVFGLAKNSRLLAAVHAAQAQAQAQFTQTGQPARVFTEFRYRTLCHDGALMRLQPTPKGHERTRGGPILDHCGGDLAVLADLAKTRRQLRRRHVDTATHRMDHLHRASLLYSGFAAVGTPRLPAPGARFLRGISTCRLGGGRERDRPFPLWVQCPKVKRSSG
jgi:hypothetical protein